MGDHMFKNNDMLSFVDHLKENFRQTETIIDSTDERLKEDEEKIKLATVEFMEIREEKVEPLKRMRKPILGIILTINKPKESSIESYEEIKQLETRKKPKFRKVIEMNKPNQSKIYSKLETVTELQMPKTTLIEVLDNLDKKNKEGESLKKEINDTWFKISRIKDKEIEALKKERNKKDEKIETLTQKVVTLTNELKKKDEEFKCFEDIAMGRINMLIKNEDSEKFKLGCQVAELEMDLDRKECEISKLKVQLIKTNKYVKHQQRNMDKEKTWLKNIISKIKKDIQYERNTKNMDMKQLNVENQKLKIENHKLMIEVGSYKEAINKERNESPRSEGTKELAGTEEINKEIQKLKQSIEGKEKHWKKQIKEKETEIKQLQDLNKILERDANDKYEQLRKQNIKMHLMNVRQKEKANTQTDKENEHDNPSILSKWNNENVSEEEEMAAKKEDVPIRYYWKFESIEQEKKFKNQIEAINDFYYKNM